MDSALREKLRSLIKDISSCDASQHHFGAAPFHRSNDIGFFGLTEPQAEIYFSILDALAPDTDPTPSRSRSAIDKAMATCILTALFDEDRGANLEERLKNSINTLDAQLNLPACEWTVWRFIDRIKTPPEGYEFGKVLFCDQHHEAARDLTERIRRLVREGGDSPAAKVWDSRLTKHTLCKIIVLACDRDAAHQNADFELSLTLDALNFFAPMLYLPDRLPGLSIRHSVSEGQDLSFCFKKDHRGVGIADYPDQYRDSWDFRIRPNDHDTALAFDRISKLLSKSANSLGDRVLGAIRWAGKASLMENPHEAFMFYAISLESLLLGRDHHEQLAYKLRLRAAHLLGPNLAARVSVRDCVNKLYALRSKIVHAGRSDLSLADVETIKIITQSCIIRVMAEDLLFRFSTDREIERWF